MMAKTTIATKTRMVTTSKTIATAFPAAGAAGAAPAGALGAGGGGRRGGGGGGDARAGGEGAPPRPPPPPPARAGAPLARWRGHPHGQPGRREGGVGRARVRVFGPRVTAGRGHLDGRRMRHHRGRVHGARRRGPRRARLRDPRRVAFALGGEEL